MKHAGSRGFESQFCRVPAFSVTVDSMPFKAMDLSAKTDLFFIIYTVACNIYTNTHIPQTLTI